METTYRWRQFVKRQWAKFQVARLKRRRAALAQCDDFHALPRANRLLDSAPVAAVAEQHPVGKEVRGVFAGRVERVEPDHIYGFVLPGYSEDAQGVELRVGRHGIVRAALDRRKDVNGGSPFAIRYTPDTYTTATIHRLPDGAELLGSPILMQPSIVAIPRPSPADARLRVLKPPRAVLAKEVALLVSHAPLNEVRSHVLPYVSALVENGVDVILVLAASGLPKPHTALLDLCSAVFVRENVGFDFAAWAHLLKLFPKLFSSDILLLVNDSVAGRFDDDHFARLLDRVRRSEAALIGLTASDEHRPHIQSYFLALKGRLLSASELHSFFDDVVVLQNKDEVIHSYELTFAEMVQKVGFKSEVLFDSPPGVNPTLHNWKALINNGFPFVKLSIPAGKFPEIQTSEWRTFLATAGFDTVCIENAIGSSGSVPVPETTFSAGSGEFSVHNIAYFGPWNEGPFSGADSHFVIAALRRCEIELSLYPLPPSVKSLQCSTMAPPLPIRDSIRAPDIVILHARLACLTVMEPSWRNSDNPAVKVIWYDDGQTELAEIKKDLPWVAASLSLNAIWSVRPAALQAPYGLHVHSIPEINAITHGNAGFERLAMSMARLIGAPIRVDQRWT